MGCGTSKGSPYIITVEETWKVALKTADSHRTRVDTSNLVVKRKGWRTIRIFVSSTFKDFHQEREVLVKRVFPDLRAWGESRRLYLVECDLRWGVPSDYTTEATLRACLGEIDRCYQDNIFPFFVNMTSERVGWVPLGNEIPKSVKEEYQWIEGLSVTEMEILHGAYRIDNPNALFMLRDPKFLDEVPQEYRGNFIDNNPIAPCKLDYLKKIIKDKFPRKRVVYYKVNYAGYNPDTNIVELSGLEDSFSKTVFEFFKQRIEKQYPLLEGESDIYEQKKEQHESFMKSRCENVVGRSDVFKKVEDYICGVGTDVPFMLLGGAGSGKSSVLARVADTACTKAMEGRIPGGGSESWHVFYHFVGAVPDSTELLPMLRRLLKELGAVSESTMPSDLETAAQTCYGVLSNPNTRPVVVIVDALNQFDEDTAATLVSWVPQKLAPHIRCVFSMINDTSPHLNLAKREPTPQILQVTPLTLEDRSAIVNELLGRYNKRLDETQTEALLSKSSSENPLWLSIACEELRVFGLFRQISDKINQLPDGLLELEQHVLSRFEQEGGGHLLVATLCLLEVSARGLLETELLTILGDEDNIKPPDDKVDDLKEKEDKGREKDPGNLSALKWSEVYRALRQFLRPFGDSGEGRLDFYHRSLSKAVRKKYFVTPSGEPDENKYLWWHGKLAAYFGKKCPNLSRKLEEYHVHLIRIKDMDSLVAFLSDWRVIEELFDDEFSAKLIGMWRKGCDLEMMETQYTALINNLMNSGSVNKDLLCRRLEIVAKILAQGGKHAKALEFAKKALQMEEDELGKRPERMADLNYLNAQVLDEIMKLEEYMYRSQLPQMMIIIGNYDAAVTYHDTQESEKSIRRAGMMLNRLAFYYSGYALRGGDAKLSAAEATEKALACVDKAIAKFQEINDLVHVGDTMVTKGVAQGRACSEQLKAYNEGEEILSRVVGEVHHCLDRLHLNMAIYLEETGDYAKAFARFRKWFDMCCQLYGIEHVKTKRPINTLREPMYRRLATEQGIPVP